MYRVSFESFVFYCWSCFHVRIWESMFYYDVSIFDLKCSFREPSSWVIKCYLHLNLICIANTDLVWSLCLHKNKVSFFLVSMDPPSRASALCFSKSASTVQCTIVSLIFFPMFGKFLSCHFTSLLKKLREYWYNSITESTNTSWYQYRNKWSG